MSDLSDGAALRFGEKLLQLLDSGLTTASYKYAVLLGLIDLCLAHTQKGGAGPTSVTTRQLAERVAALYWPQRRRTPQHPHLLRQKKGNEDAAVLRIIDGAQATAPGLTLWEFRKRRPVEYSAMVVAIEYRIAKEPLPRLQFFGGQEERFIYEIGWDVRHPPTEAQVRRLDFDNRINFIGSASDHLVRLASLIRPLLQRRWTQLVAAFNRDIIADSQLEEFLFGVDRTAVAKLAPVLRELEDNRCFYCGQALGEQLHVDHFLPWSRFADDGLWNLVPADPKCNLEKQAHLAGTSHLAHWAPRFQAGSPIFRSLNAIADEFSWPAEPEVTLATARGAYLRLPEDSRLWLRRRDLEVADLDRIRSILAA